MGNMTNVLNDIKTAVVKHSPEILMGVGIAGMVTTTVLAVKATPKALKLIEERKEKEGKEKLTPLETVETTWKCYIPTAAVAVASMGCLIGSTTIGVKRHAALLTAYRIAETAHEEYKEQVVETVGEKKEKEVVDNLAQKHLEKNPVTSNEIHSTPHGNTLCYEAFSGRYFRSDMQAIRSAVNDLNEDMLSYNYASLNDLYEKIGLESTDMGYELGWNILNGGKIEVRYSSQLASTGEPCLVMTFKNAPRYDYSTFMN